MIKKQMSWQNLLSKKRYYSGENVSNNKDIRAEYLIDVDRIIYSFYFRKLQDKTQVYPLAKSDSVRTRLTHSLEVAGVGRSLGVAIGTRLLKKYNLVNITEHDFGYILQAACLAHDIGNPPFGHLGEEAIISFLKSRAHFLENKITKDEYNDLITFDGNSQGFRIITNLAGWNNSGGLRLTYATLGAFCKYSRSFVSIETINDYKKKHDISSKLVGHTKSGVLSTEKDMFEDVAQELGLIRVIEGQSMFFRHPLAFLVESADDICYCVADTEDAFFANIIALYQVEKILAPIARNPNKYPGNSEQRTNALREEEFYKNMDERQKVEFLRGKAIGNLIGEVERVFIENESLILRGEFNHELLSLTCFKNEIDSCKEFSQRYIFESSEKLKGDIKGFETITGVLEELFSIIDNFNHPKSKRIKILLNDRLSPDKSYYENIVTIIDIISEFADRNLVEFLNTLRGL